MAIELYAIWSYDHYPYYLCGKVVKMTAQGNVAIEGYDGMLFKPVKLIPAETGIYIAMKLDEIKDKYNCAKQIFEEQWRKQVEVLVRN